MPCADMVGRHARLQGPLAAAACHAWALAESVAAMRVRRDGGWLAIHVGVTRWQACLCWRGLCRSPQQTCSCAARALIAPLAVFWVRHLG